MPTPTCTATSPSTGCADDVVDLVPLLRRTVRAPRVHRVGAVTLVSESTLQQVFTDRVADRASLDRVTPEHAARLVRDARTCTNAAMAALSDDSLPPWGDTSPQQGRMRP